MFLKVKKKKTIILLLYCKVRILFKLLCQLNLARKFHSWDAAIFFHHTTPHCAASAEGIC